MNRMIAVVGLLLAAVAVTFASHAPAAFHRGAYAFRGYYPGKLWRTRMWANAQRDGRPAEYRWRPLFNAAKFG